MKGFVATFWSCGVAALRSVTDSQHDALEFVEGLGGAAGSTGCSYTDDVVQESLSGLQDLSGLSLSPDSPVVKALQKSRESINTNILEMNINSLKNLDSNCNGKADMEELKSFYANDEWVKKGLPKSFASLKPEDAIPIHLRYVTLRPLTWSKSSTLGLADLMYWSVWQYRFAWVLGVGDTWSTDYDRDAFFLFKLLDKNGDFVVENELGQGTRITHKEFISDLENFRVADTNNDMRVSVDELMQAKHIEREDAKERIQNQKKWLGDSWLEDGQSLTYLDWYFTVYKP